MNKLSPWTIVSNNFWWVELNSVFKIYRIRFLWKGRIYQWDFHFSQVRYDLVEDGFYPNERIRIRRESC